MQQFGVLNFSDRLVSASESRFLLCLFSGTFRAVESVTRLLQHTFNSRFKNHTVPVFSVQMTS